MSYSLMNSSKGVTYGLGSKLLKGGFCRGLYRDPTLGLVRGDTWSLDYSSCRAH